MMGDWGYRPLAEFVEVYGQAVCQKLELAPGTKLPSYSTFSRVMQQLDDHVLISILDVNVPSKKRETASTYILGAVVMPSCA